ncbi:3-oxoacyl-[acyl-carrier-protein] reductase [Clostridium sp.]|uniref:3-oxoacyl-[acyl-carrier-protein] reductase n=1 Tax=Clostridium sp. TaxID=1506 RepID=UPI003994E7E2
MLKNKCAIVTGGTRGIGKAIVLELATLGANVVIGYRSSDKEAEELKSEVEKLGSKAILVKGNVSESTYAKKLISTCKENYGRVDILINNAGITKDNLILRMSESEFDDVINVNLKGTFNCSKEASTVMLKQRYGKIINMASVIGVIGNAGQANYAASKAGIIALTKSMAKELGSRGILVNAIAPGFIETDMTAKLPEEIKNSIKTNIALKKLGTPSDIAKLIAFLASDNSNYITGQVINIDGGMVM